MKINNIFLSLVAAAIIPAIFFILISSIVDNSFMGWIVIIFPFVLLATSLHTIIFGIPLILLLRIFNILNLRFTLLVGFMIGAIPTPTITILSTWLRNEKITDWPYILKAIGSCGILGIIGGIAFWIVFNNLKKCK